MLLVGICGLIVLVLLPWGLFSLKRKRLIENVSTSKVKGVFLGLNEVKGRAVSDEPIVSFLAEEVCVYYRYEVQERWERTETYRDSKGNTRTRTVSGWTTVDEHEARPAFELEDRTGRIRILPQRAEIDADTVFDRHCGRSDPLYYGKGPARAIANSDHRRHFVEKAIPLDARIYVLGAARLRKDKAEPEIAHSREAELFLISTKGEQQLTRGYGIAAGVKLAIGALAAFLLPVGFSLQEGHEFGRALSLQMSACLAVAGGCLGVIALYYLVLVYNGLVSVRERAEMALSMIDVQLRRRHVLIPRLAACVKAYATHEEEAQRRVAELRTGAGREDEVEEQGRALTRIFLLAESYPELKADENFARLQRELVDTEDRIALAREFHNASTTALNNRIESLPDSLVARLTRFKAGEYFAARGFERSPVQIDL